MEQMDINDDRARDQIRKDVNNVVMCIDEASSNSRPAGESPHALTPKEKEGDKDPMKKKQRFA